MITDTTREEIARAICKHRHPKSDPSAVIREGLVAWQLFKSEATAIEPIINRLIEEARDKALEAAAGVAEAYPSPMNDLPMAVAMQSVARVIRTLDRATILAEAQADGEHDG